MPKIIWMCPVCCKNLDRKAFLRPFKQRLIVERACFSCRTATLLRDNSGRAIQRALWRGDITELDARALQTKLNLLRKERATRRRNNVVSKLRKRQAEMKRYGAGLEKEQERRAKISAALTGRKRGSYMKVKTRI